jgi:hypothetical protein
VGREGGKLPLAIRGGLRYAGGMRSALTAVVTLLVLGTLLSGCSKCDPWWGEKPSACHSDVPVR